MEIPTPLGPIVFQGRDTGRPVHLVITGAFARPTQMGNCQNILPDADVWRAHLPGNHCPPLIACSIGAFGFAFSHALRRRLNGRRAAVTGVSAGALVALALEGDLVSALVLADPPLRPSSAWPFGALYEQARDEDRDFIWRIFGWGAGITEPRDYTPLLDRLSAPTIALVGEERLGDPRPFLESPSVVDDVSRALLEAHPGVQVIEVAGRGHRVYSDSQIIEAMRWASTQKGPPP